ncbi:hypothetical protein BpHYR1_022723 [Brachionus plicatilis]|uniref:Uncharacterized protein n=1 Tax=Brachionus plicatilis TaxID=10195 RepID=A0A3M7Q282_BRAPC|nr:hypothetical protein BpHYR1_022723 [Brachionus plicatilis]
MILNPVINLTLVRFDSQYYFNQLAKSDVAKISPNISKIKYTLIIEHFQCILKINIPYTLDFTIEVFYLWRNSIYFRENNNGLFP